MTTSGTATWNPGASSIINGALRLIGAIASGETPPASEYADALMALNGLIKSWQVSGVHVWAQAEGTLVLQPGQAQYAIGVNSADHATGAAGITASTVLAAAGAVQVALASGAGIAVGSQVGIVLDAGPVFWSSVVSVSGSTVYLASALPSQASAGAAVVACGAPFARPLKVSGARVVDPATGVETPLIPMSRLDYANLSGKTAPAGVPAQYFYDPQLGSGVFSVFPAPAAGLTVVRFTCQRPLQDFSSQADTADVPQEWSSALRFALAVELGPEYDCPQARMTMLKGMADEKFAVVSKWDIEPEGTATSPFGQPVYQMIAGALRLCGAVGPQDVPRLGLVDNAFTALNAMVQSWQASGIHVWAEEDCTLFLQPGQVRYLLGAGSPDAATLSSQWVEGALAVSGAAGAVQVSAALAGVAAGDRVGVWLDAGCTFWTTAASVGGGTVTLAAALPSQASAGARVVSYATPLIRPLRVPAARRCRLAPPGGQAIEIPVVPMSRLDYAAVPNKATPGTVTQFFYDPQLGAGVLHVWPAPCDDGSALKFTAQRPLTTFATLASVPDFPDEWLAALRWNLAVELWPEYNGARGNPAQYALLKEEARGKLMVAQGWDREPQSVLFGAGVGPAGRSG
ncbi:conserved hypothetical protein [Gluconacetobacter diazotrophicus PA1 5]|uniref:Uncharacterized protein n=2 Tax=Gluconacetobacter diazotrophicus TaxID=33996 RepID=A9H7C3_GLUDA|nr:hypothetical protein [Gluconacetobacter diazotrophicus]ACI52306.1 conserved hypothetical protein [Gluconacetobacter diazotrophicus PA1 5]MBB2156857.1 hypothetical protein [Gluconacetobacter diazotrophicus]TWB04799.1 hypothetical protein FBZ86_11921 [Gluconacetobacter diazotrophicus]CAP57620.1 hypothetical protein GDI3677 [Gluconacetobacter diazotrophicus PA1 5]